MEWAAAHGGVVTKEKLAELGLTANEIRGRVRRRGWTSLGRGAYRVMPARDGKDLLLAAVAVHEHAVVSHEAAAEIHGFTRIPPGRLVVTMHSRTTHDFPGVTTHRAHDLDDSHVMRIGGLRVTTPERTVVDIAAGRPPALMGRIVDDLVARQIIDLQLVAKIVNTIGRRGKPGIGTMRKVLDLRIGEPRDQSVLERRARKLIRDAGLPIPIPEYAIPWAPRRRFDDAYPDLKLAIEWDGKRYHGQLDAFDTDRVRDRHAIIHGWRVLRFTWIEVVEQPEMVVDEIRRAINAGLRSAG